MYVCKFCINILRTYVKHNLFKVKYNKAATDDEQCLARHSSTDQLLLFMDEASE
jgi:hypothetical protein